MNILLLFQQLIRVFIQKFRKKKDMEEDGIDCCLVGTITEFHQVKFLV